MTRTSALYLIDTNVFSETIRLQPEPKILEKMDRHEGVIATATVVIHELLFGCWRLPDSKRRRKIEESVETMMGSAMPIFPYCIEAAKWHANERARLTNQGKTPSYSDSQIAAIAAVNRLILVTRNIADYENFQGITLENWHD
jgi:tRNA(fMet)-specific endonuclease VapC